MPKKRGPSVKRGLLLKSREAALNAVQTFNNPLTIFKAETFIVLMNIAWMYLLHAYYRQEGIEYRYYRKGSQRRKFDRTKSGAFKYWELERCLNDDACPLDGPTQHNLRFLIGLRNEIEHHQSAGVVQRFSGHFFACCLNYERYVCELFSERYSLGEATAFTLQFRDFTAAGSQTQEPEPLPSAIAKYVQEFSTDLPEEELNSPYFRRRFLFVPVATNKNAQADEVIQFVRPDSELAVSINDAYDRILFKEVERPKFLPTQIVKLMKSEGYKGFRLRNHTELWQTLGGKNPGEGYGHELGGRWFWYSRWVDVVRQHCADNVELYMAA